MLQQHFLTYRLEVYFAQLLQVEIIKAVIDLACWEYGYLRHINGQLHDLVGDAAHHLHHVFNENGPSAFQAFQLRLYRRLLTHDLLHTPHQLLLHLGTT